MMDFAIFTDVDDSNLSKTIRACKASDISLNGKTDANTIGLTSGIKATLHAAWNSASSEGLNITSAFQAAERMKAFYDISHSYQPSLFASYLDTVVAVHTGPGVDRDFMAKALLEELINYLQESGSEETLILQICHKDYTLGVLVGTGHSRLGTVQQAMQHWINGTCVSGYENSARVKSMTLVAPVTSGLLSLSNSTKASQLKSRGGCTTIQVQPNDLCGSLATKCGISLNDFYKYNPGKASAIIFNWARKYVAALGVCLCLVRIQTVLALPTRFMLRTHVL